MTWLKDRLSANEPCRGVWLSIPSPAATRLLASLPCDWMAVDAEHGPMGAETMTAMVAAIAAAGRAPIVRVAHGGVENLKRALDAGAWGVIAPMIESAEQAAAVVAAAKYPPAGKRSFGSAWAGLTFGWSMAEYRQQANAATLAFAQIESAEAVDRLAEIASVPGLDGLFVGPVDLAISLGLDPAPENPALQAALTEVVAAARANGLVAGIYCSGAEAAEQRIREGFTLVNVATDVMAMLSGVRAQLEWQRPATHPTPP